MDKYEYAVTKELEWLREDEEITRDLTRRYDAGENRGWSRQYLTDRMGFIFDEQTRLHMWMDEFLSNDDMTEERNEEE